MKEKKSFLGKLMDKLDQKMEKKAKKSCGCQEKQKDNKSCCK